MCVQTALSPSSSLRSPANSTDSEREASEVRRDEPDEAWLGGRLPISRLIQCSHKEELVDPKLPDSRQILVGATLRDLMRFMVIVIAKQRTILIQ